MALQNGQLATQLLELLGVDTEHVLEAHIHMKRNDIIRVDITRYATRQDGEFEFTDGEKAKIKQEVKKYALVEIDGE